MAQKYDDSEGVWRTIGGRKVFIKNGQSLSDAMKESGKFKPAKKGSTNGKKPMNQEEFSKKIDEITKSKSYKEKMDKAVDELNKKYGYEKDEKSASTLTDRDAKDLFKQLNDEGSDFSFNDDVKIEDGMIKTNVGVFMPDERGYVERELEIPISENETYDSLEAKMRDWQERHSSPDTFEDEDFKRLKDQNDYTNPSQEDSIERQRLISDLRQNMSRDDYLDFIDQTTKKQISNDEIKAKLEDAKKSNGSTDAQELEKEGIKKISSKESSKYVEDWTNHENRDDYGKYYSQDGDKFVAIDNSAGECYVEEFDNEKDAIDYLKGKDPEEIRASKEKSNGSNEIKNFQSEYTGGGVDVYGGEIGDYTFIADSEGLVEFFDKDRNMTLDRYLQDDVYDEEQEYAKFGKDVPEGLEQQVREQIKGAYTKEHPEVSDEEVNKRLGITETPKSQEDYVNDDEKGLEYSFRTNDRDMFEVRYNRTGNNKNMDFATSASKFNRNRTDYEQAGQAQKDILAEGTKAREFFDKWDKKHLGSLTQKEYEELANDIEELKKEYPYVEGSRFNDQVELDRSSKKASKSKTNNTTNEAIKTRNNAIDNEILDRYSKDYGYDSDDNLKNLKGQIDYMRNPNESINQTAQRLVDGGDFLIYNGDVKDWLKSNNIKYNENNYWDTYKKEMANRIEKLYNQKETPKTTNGSTNGNIIEEAINKENKFKTGDKAIYNGNEVEILHTNRDPRYGNEYLVRGDEGNVWVTDANLDLVENKKTMNDKIRAGANKTTNKKIPNNLSKDIYELDVDKGNAWSGSGKTKNANGDELARVTKNGPSQNSPQDIKEAIEKKYPHLEGKIVGNNEVQFFVRKNKTTNETMNDKIRDEAYRKYMKEHPNSKITLEDFLKNKKK